jgi:6-phosphogluconolactonase (cycloisomerase 2 family)
MKRLIACMAALCLVALTVGCGGVSSSGTLAYVSNSTGTGFTVFTVNTNGTLTPASISPQTTPAAPKMLQFSPNGRWAYFLDTPGTNIIAFTRAGNGTLATHIDTIPVNGAASSLVISPNNLFLYVSLPGALTGELATYRIDQSTGDLFQVFGSNTPLGFSITQLLMAPNGSVLYGLAPAQQAVLTFTLNASTGLATGPNTFAVGPTPPCRDYLTNTADQAPCGGMILSANGNFLYVVDQTATGSFTNIVTGLSGSPFHENADLIQVGGQNLFPTEPVAGVTSSDSRFLFIANLGTKNISVFKIGTGSPLGLGELDEVKGPGLITVNGNQVSTQSPFDCGTGCSAPDFLSVSKTNNALFVLDTNAAKIFQFNVDQNTGRLRPLSPASLSAGATPTFITLR